MNTLRLLLPTSPKVISVPKVARVVVSSFTVNPEESINTCSAANFPTLADAPKDATLTSLSTIPKPVEVTSA